jgi:hypothetical protein
VSKGISLIIFCGKYIMISFNTKSKEIKELLNLSDKKIEMEDFVFDSTNLQIYFQEVIQNINDNNKSVELKVINLKNGNILNNKLNFPVDNAFHIGMDERGIYYKTSYYKEKSPTENGGMDEYFENNKVIFWDIDIEVLSRNIDTESQAMATNCATTMSRLTAKVPNGKKIPRHVHYRVIGNSMMERVRTVFY